MLDYIESLIIFVLAHQENRMQISVSNPSRHPIPRLSSQSDPPQPPTPPNTPVSRKKPVMPNLKNKLHLTG